LLVRNPTKPRKPTLASLWAALLWKTYAQPTVWNETPIPRLGTAFFELTVKVQRVLRQH
jgi:hypothetical protein